MHLCLLLCYYAGTARPSLQEFDSQTHSPEGLHLPSTDECWLVAELGRLRLQSSVTEGTGFLTLEVLPCARQLTLRLSGPFPVYVTHPVSRSCQAEGRATEQRARPGREACILGKVPHRSRAASCFQERMCFQGCGVTVLKARGSVGTQVWCGRQLQSSPHLWLSVVFLIRAFEFLIRTERLCSAVNRNKTTKASQ